MATWIGGTAASIVAAFLGIRKWMSSDAASRAGDAAEIAFLETLIEQLATANKRADDFARERNEAMMQIGELKAQIAALQATVEHMQRQLDTFIRPQS